ncbi:MAG: flavodoxin family protein [Thermoleophilia bacterium]|nr:flavodoxin family protein [Thermoleophilia bacterium]
MTAQVLGISGSPIAGGSTDRIVRLILDATGLECEFVRLWDLDVRPCKACLACAASNVCTSFDDDWLPLATKIVRADALVLGGWAPFNILDARTKTVPERMFSLRHSILLGAGKIGVAVVTGTVDPVPIADGLLAWFATEGLRPLGRVTPAGTDPCWSCGFGDACVQGAPVPLARGEYDLFEYPYADRLPAPKDFAISPEVIPPPVEDQAHVVAEAERLGREIAAGARQSERERHGALERLAPGAASLEPLPRLRALLEAGTAGVAVDVGEELSALLARAGEQADHGAARGAVISLLALGRKALLRSAEQPATELLVTEVRHAVAELYEAATEK